MAKLIKKGNGETHPQPQARFHYIKNNQFRVIHADGVIGNITPHGKLHMSFYSERSAIPREMVYPINEDGSLGSAIQEETVGREGFVRELDVDVMMDIDAAEEIYKFLGKTIERYKKSFNKREK